MAEFDDLRGAADEGDAAQALMASLVDPGGEMRWWMPVFPPTDGLEPSEFVVRLIDTDVSDAGASHSVLKLLHPILGASTAVLSPTFVPEPDLATRIESVSGSSGPTLGKYAVGGDIEDLFQEDIEFEELTQKFQTQRRIALLVAITLFVSLASASGFLYHSRVDLGKAHARVLADAARLQREQQQANQLATEKASLIAQLTQKQNDLESTKSNLSNQVSNRGEDIKTLKACLDGVTKALVQAGANDVSGAQGTISGINDVCAKAQQIQ